jgi:hypothetical protein
MQLVYSKYIPRAQELYSGFQHSLSNAFHSVVLAQSCMHISLLVPRIERRVIAKAGIADFRARLAALRRGASCAGKLADGMGNQDGRCANVFGSLDSGV